MAAKGEFHGTIYAPEANISLAADFELFGAVAILLGLSGPPEAGDEALRQQIPTAKGPVETRDP